MNDTERYIQYEGEIPPGVAEIHVQILQRTKGADTERFFVQERLTSWGHVWRGAEGESPKVRD